MSDPSVDTFVHVHKREKSRLGPCLRDYRLQTAANLAVRVVRGTRNYEGEREKVTDQQNDKVASSGIDGKRL